MKKSQWIFTIILVTIILSLAGEFTSLAKTHDLIFEKGDIIEMGVYGGEPIAWQIIHMDENGNPLLFSKRILTIKPFDASGDAYEHDGYYGYDRYYGSNNWETSTLRQWLNSDKGSIKWKYNAPNSENVFNGENPYESEKGFLHKDNFTKHEQDIILEHKYKDQNEKQLEDKVFLLSVEELSLHTLDENLYPLQVLTHSSIKENNYKSKRLSVGKQYSIWTRDGIQNVPHAVKTFSEGQTEAYEVSNAGRVGVNPAIYLDMERIDISLITGTGLGGNPYKLNLYPVNNIFINLFIIFVVILILLRVFKFKKPRNNKMIVLIVLLSIIALTGCKQDSVGKDKDTYNDQYNSYLVVLQYAKNKNLIIRRIEELYKGERIVVVGQDGSQHNKEILEVFDKPLVNEDYEKIIDYVYSRDWIIAREGDYRVTDIKREIDDVYKDISKVLDKTSPIVLEETDFTDKMILDTQIFYDIDDYYSIQKYLEDNDLLILHPYDSSPMGIGLLYLNININY